MLSARKAERFEHSADKTADILFNIALDLRFGHRGETQLNSVENLLGNLVDVRPEEALKHCIITANRGY